MINTCDYVLQKLMVLHVGRIQINRLLYRQLGVIIVQLTKKTNC